MCVDRRRRSLRYKTLGPTPLHKPLILFFYKFIDAIVVNILQVYVCRTVDDAASAVDRFAMCLADIEPWLRASRLRLNPTKTQITWLGSSQQLAKLDITHVRVLSSYLRVHGHSP